MTRSAIENFFTHLPQLRLLVVGDVMSDAYAWGESNRMSPEAPVPVIEIKSTEHRPGGAANVALNLRSMGVTCSLVGLVGNDEAGALLRKQLKDAGIQTEGLVVTSTRPTTIKTRLMIGQQQLARIDHESTSEATEAEATELLAAYRQALGEADAVIFQDYDKGVLSSSLIPAYLQMAREAGIPTAVDPKKEHFFDFIAVDLFKPNLKELSEGMGLKLQKNDTPAIQQAVVELRKKLQARAILLTMSEAGVMFESEEGSGHLPAHLRRIADVSGAGDTVIAVAGCCLAAGLPWEQLAVLSNLAGGLVCETMGVVPIKSDKLLAEALQNAT
jgi:rfaE bifunctional protein kinase chain/domain